ncbi:hypothetical protein KSP39_PZI007174 [Platanthera zijinensis]|uniref:DUF3741 domain-containing protein n=1 Tax=Platanthera zijinensis TaxID=2320716 RepID=A0AAP0BSM6_9ASPA
MKLAVPSSFELRSDRAEAAGCITGVLRRILCRSLRERSYRDEDKEVGTRSERRLAKQGKCEVARASRTPSPGLVARLMGLETSAAFPFAQPEMISRTRSANSAEASIGAGKLSEQRSGSHLRKSQSFHEGPSYLRKESEEFLVLTFGDYDDGEASELIPMRVDFDVGMENRNVSRGERKLTEKKRRGNRMRENDAESNRCDAAKAFVSTSTEKEMEPNEMIVRGRKKLCFAQGEMETECSTQNSSPVSVFDLPLQLDTECLIVPDSSVLVELQKISLEVERESKEAKICEMVAQDLPDIWERICKLGEEDLIKQNWITKKIKESKEAEELGYVIWHDILDLLLHEAVLDMWY